MKRSFWGQASLEACLPPKTPKCLRLGDGHIGHVGEGEIQQL